MIVSTLSWIVSQFKRLMLLAYLKSPPFLLGDAVQAKLPSDASYIAFDGVTHHAVSGGSAVFKKDFPQYIASLLPPAPSSMRVVVNLGVQPNSSPHLGTICSIALGFCVGHHLATLGYKPTFVLDLRDHSKATQQTIDGVIYLRGLRASGRLADNIDDYYELCEKMKARWGVDYEVRMEGDFLRHPHVPEIIREIVKARDVLGPRLSPGRGRLPMRFLCPIPECGLVDKYGANVRFDDEREMVHAVCPEHGAFSVSLASQCHQLEFNAQLWNFVIGKFYEGSPEKHGVGYVQICGSDYSGFWQEQLLWRYLRSPLIIIYTPLMVDWSGEKLSKSLYLKGDAYKYLCDAGMEYLLSYKCFKGMGKNLGVLLDEVDLWLREPYRLFRTYSAHHMHALFCKKEMENGSGSRETQWNERVHNVVK